MLWAMSRRWKRKVSGAMSKPLRTGLMVSGVVEGSFMSTNYTITPILSIPPSGSAATAHTRDNYLPAHSRAGRWDGGEQVGSGGGDPTRERKASTNVRISPR